MSEADNDPFFERIKELKTQVKELSGEKIQLAKCHERSRNKDKRIEELKAQVRLRDAQVAFYEELEGKRVTDPLTIAMYKEMSKRHTEMTLQVKELEALLNEYKGAECRAVKLHGEALAQVKELQDTITELKDSVFQYGIENTKLQLKIEKLETEIEEMHEDAAGEDI